MGMPWGRGGGKAARLEQTKPFGHGWAERVEAAGEEGAAGAGAGRGGGQKRAAGSLSIARITVSTRFVHVLGGKSGSIEAETWR